MLKLRVLLCRRRQGEKVSRSGIIRRLSAVGAEKETIDK